LILTNPKPIPTPLGSSCGSISFAGRSDAQSSTAFELALPPKKAAISVEAATVEVVASSVPEPSTLLLTATSLLGILAVRKFGRKKEEATSTGKHSN
jgi:hypothetical protein